MSKHKLNTHYRGSPRGGRTQQHAYCLRYAHSQHIESHLGKKQQQAKIPIAFLFSQLHFNNITLHALFYGGFLLCAVRDAQCKTRESPYNSRFLNINRQMETFLDSQSRFIQDPGCKPVVDKETWSPPPSKQFLTKSMVWSEISLNFHLAE